MMEGGAGLTTSANTVLRGETASYCGKEEIPCSKVTAQSQWHHGRRIITLWTCMKPLTKMTTDRSIGRRHFYS